MYAFGDELQGSSFGFVLYKYFITDLRQKKLMDGMKETWFLKVINGDNVRKTLYLALQTNSIYRGWDQ